MPVHEKTDNACPPQKIEGHLQTAYPIVNVHQKHQGQQRFHKKAPRKFVTVILHVDFLLK